MQLSKTFHCTQNKTQPLHPRGLPALLSCPVVSLLTCLQPCCSPCSLLATPDSSCVRAFACVLYSARLLASLLFAWVAISHPPHLSLNVTSFRGLFLRDHPAESVPGHALWSPCGFPPCPSHKPHYFIYLLVLRPFPSTGL